MNSGLYAWAGASATASAAACAKRFDDPITKESKVYFGFQPTPAGSARGGSTASGRCGPAPVRLDGLGSGGAVDLPDGELDPPFPARGIAHGGADQADEMAFDPVT